VTTNTQRFNGTPLNTTVSPSRSGSSATAGRGKVIPSLFPGLTDADLLAGKYPGRRSRDAETEARRRGLKG
jgi:hypothetical protein